MYWQILKGLYLEYFDQSRFRSCKT